MYTSSILPVLLLAGAGTTLAGTYSCRDNASDRVSKQCCSTDYALGGYYADVGAGQFKSDISSLATQAFLNGRGNGNPRSLCDTSSKGNRLCVSWATYSGGALPSDLAEYIAETTAGCQNPSGSSQFYIRLNDGSSSTLCVSSDPNTCGVFF